MHYEEGKKDRQPPLDIPVGPLEEMESVLFHKSLPVLRKYLIERRKEEALKSLQNADSMHDIYRLQGKVRAVDRILEDIKLLKEYFNKDGG